MNAGTPRTYLGALHVHTDSDGGESTLDEIVVRARDAGLDYLIFTGHSNRKEPLEFFTGWRQGVLVITAEEVMTPQGHLLALETRHPIGNKDTLQEAIDAVHEQCGTVVSIHQQLPTFPLIPGQGDMQRVPLEKAGLLEIWCFMDEFLARATPKHFFTVLKKPERLLEGPTRHQLSRWDLELTKRLLPIVAGLNLHHRKHPLLEWKEIIQPRLALGTLATCAQTGELPSVAIRARDLILNALREGRSYVVNRTNGPAMGFEFYYEDPDGRIRQMGDDVPYVPGGRFWIRLPKEGEIVLRQNGYPLFWGTGKQIHFPATGPGVYRVEVRQDRRLWILSNPIRMVDDEGIIQPTVSDFT